MGFDAGVIMSILAAFGGFVAWLIREIRNRNKISLDLDRRISNIEQKIAMNDMQDLSDRRAIGDVNEGIKENKSSIRDLEIRLRKTETQIAVLQNDTQKNGNN